MERKIKFESSEGWGSPILRMGLVGDKGSVVFSLVTNWKTSTEMRLFQGTATGEAIEVMKAVQPSLHFLMWSPNPIDLGYHSKTPMYPDQMPMKEGRIPFKADGTIDVEANALQPDQHCEWTNGPCFYDGSSLNAINIFDAFVSKGEEFFWKEMEDYYNSTFNSVPSMNEDRLEQGPALVNNGSVGL